MLAPWLMSAGIALAAPNGGAIEDEGIDELLDLFDDQVDAETSVADRAARSQREASALVTVFTGEELRRLGARDLVDALQLIPSVQFGMDVWNVDLMTSRGVSAEGRVLLLIDDHEVTELVYGAVPWSHRVPATIIDRVEVIRGPGSAVYGGYAMLTVIRVHTRAESISGAQVDARASALPTGAYGRQDLSLSAGTRLGDDARIGLAATVGRGRRADAIYSDLDGHSVDLGPVSDLDPALVSFDLNVGEVELSVLGEDFRVVWQDGGVHIPARDRDAMFPGLYGRVQWDHDLSDRLALSVRGTSQWQVPWRSTRNAPAGSFAYFRTSVHRTIGRAELAWRPHDRLTLVGGGEAGVLRAVAAPDQIQDWDFTWLLGAAWAEGTVETEPVNVTLGTRFDASSAYGEALSPRLALARAWRRYHYKLGISRAFRAPGVAQASPTVVPETTTAIDGELGIGPSAWSYLTVSAFDNRLVDPLVYRYEFDPVTGEEFDGYVNGDPMHTIGADVDLQLLLGTLRLGIGGGTVAVVEEAPIDWRVPQAEHRAIGVPAGKAVARATWAPTERWSLGGVATWVGSRWGIVAQQADGDPLFDEIPGGLLLDASAEVHHVGFRGLGIGLSCHDLLNTAPPLVQSYRGFHAPTPAAGREVMLRVTVER